MDNLKHPRVSVIIATYNCAQYLPEAIESVFKQTLKDWELIIVNDGSTDETDEIVNPYCADQRVKYISQENRGLAAARNRGMKDSKGEYIQFLDADDLIHNEKLKRQGDYLDGHKDVDVVFSEYSFFKDDLQGILIEPPCRKFSKDIRKDMLKGNLIVVNSTLAKRSAIEKAGGFDETLTSTEDWDLWLRLLQSGAAFVRINDKLAFVRLHQKRMSRNSLNMYWGRYRVIQKVLKNIARKSIYWPTAKGCYVRSKLALAREYVCRKKIKKAIEVMKERPYHFSIQGTINFLIETAINLKAIKQGS